MIRVFRQAAPDGHEGRAQAALAELTKDQDDLRKAPVMEQIMAGRSWKLGEPDQRTAANCPGVETARMPDLPSNRSVEWVRIHRLPDHAYFDHSVHVSAGVGCASCHGRVDQMVVMRQAEPLSMGWCLDCHRNPAPHIRPLDQITNMNWSGPAVDPPRPLNPPQTCSGCHR